MMLKGSLFSRTGLITAKRFFSHKITGGLVSPCATAPADPFIFAGPAFALQLVVISQIHKDI
jgi:hypothetical protein